MKAFACLVRRARCALQAHRRNSMPKTLTFNSLRRRYESSLARCGREIEEKNRNTPADAACNRQDARDRKIFAAVESAAPPSTKNEAVALLTIADLAMGDHHHEELVRPMIQKAIVGLARFGQ